MGDGETTSKVIGGKWASKDIRGAAAFRQEYLHLMLCGEECKTSYYCVGGVLLHG